MLRSGLLLSWLTLGVMMALSTRWLWETIWWTMPLWLLYTLLGVGLALWELSDIVRSGFRWHVGLRAGVILISGFALWLGYNGLASRGERWLQDRRFERNVVLYTKIVTQVVGEPAPLGVVREERESVRYLVDPGPPIRIAFPQPGGLIDNWEAIIFDSTGNVLQASGWTSEYKFTAPASIRGLFGGDLLACVLVHEPYYRCVFT